MFAELTHNKTQWFQRSSIFFIGLLIRLGFGYIFYGSSDVDAFVKIADRALSGTWLTAPFYLTIGGCTFPVIPFYAWLGGYIQILTSWPAAFCIKIIPIFFDVLLAVLIYDFMRHIQSKYAFRAGLLYALSPIAIITVCIHGQWESVSLFLFVLSLYIRECYFDSYVKYFLYGSLFTLSFLVKPLSLIFILFFFIPWTGMKKSLGKLWNIGIITGASLGVLLCSCFIIFKTCRWLTMGSLIDICRVMYSPWVLVLIFVLCLLACAYIYTCASKLAFSPDTKRYIRYQITAIMGAVSTLILCFSAFYWYGINCIKIFDNLFRYGNSGVQICGLPFAYPFDQMPIVWFLTNRFLLIVLLSFVALFYYKNRIDIFKTIILSLALAFGLFGVSPQYMIWMLPFLLFVNFYKISALFNIILTIFFLLFYTNPFINPEYPHLMSMCFSTLKNWACLMPPICLTDISLLRFVKLFGNYISPIFFIMLALYVIRSHGRKNVIITFRRTNPLKLGYFWIFTVLSFGITLCVFTVSRARFGDFSQAVITRYDRFAAIMQNGYVIGDYPVYSLCNGVTILLLLGLIWSIYTFLLGRHDNKIS